LPDRGGVSAEGAPTEATRMATATRGAFEKPFMAGPFRIQRPHATYREFSEGQRRLPCFAASPVLIVTRRRAG
jgi:hypothetical protein